MDYLGASGAEVIPYNNLFGMRLVAAWTDSGVACLQILVKKLLQFVTHGDFRLLATFLKAKLRLQPGLLALWIF